MGQLIMAILFFDTVVYSQRKIGAGEGNPLSPTAYRRFLRGPAALASSAQGQRSGRLRFPLSYPTHKKGRALSGTALLPKMERVMGIEPTSEAWEASILPLNYTRSWRSTGSRPKG